MTRNRNLASSVLLNDKKWWISGGVGYYSSEYLQVGKSSFRTFVNLPGKLNQHKLIQVNETVIILVGNEVYAFNIQTTSFSQLPEMRTARENPQAGML